MSKHTRNLSLKERANEIANAIRFSRNVQQEINSKRYLSSNDVSLIGTCTSYRKRVLSVESRCMNLAKACIAGTPYYDVEDPDYTTSLTVDIVYRTAEIVYEHRPEEMEDITMDLVHQYVSAWFYEEF